MEFYEASAKTADQVNFAFLSLARKLMKKKDLPGPITKSITP